jgi:hypothetical protein
MAKSVMGKRTPTAAAKKPTITAKQTQEDIKKDAREWKEINGKRVKVKYKAFRLPLDFIKQLNIYAAEKETPLENIVYSALTEYMKNNK